MADNIIWLDFNDAPDQHALPERDTEALRRGLLDHLEEALKHLFPEGKIRGRQFFIGDVQGTPGKSLVVTLDGEHRGLWKDFATDEGGDAIDLWAAARGLSAKRDFPQVAEEISRWLGHSVAPAIPGSRDTRASCPSPRPRGKPDRKRTEPHLDDLGPYTAKWDYRDSDGQLIACVYRFDPHTGKEYRPWDVRARLWRAPNPRPLYNLPAVAKGREVVLVEGEKAADALIREGLNATTAMNGARAPVDKTDWSPLEGKEVLIWPDRDPPGWDYAENAARACVQAGSRSVVILVPPADKPEKWDAADAVTEGFDVKAFIAQGERRIIKAPTSPLARATSCSHGSRTWPRAATSWVCARRAPCGCSTCRPRSSTTTCASG